MSSFDPDHALAVLLQAKFNEEAKMERKKEKENIPVPIRKHLPKTSLVDPEWETTDPCPDIHGLFLAFNDRFFWGRLTSIVVQWSQQMTSCAGICMYDNRSGMCAVRLSAPLLKLRPRSDLVETLLHEMIHAYLFVTKNNRDRDGHGPEFHKHMYRINKEAGTNITVHHSFIAEVSLYKQHWWRCNGPCQHKSPYYGMLKRARNRAPGPNDFWWSEHQAVCGGTFIKVREPENFNCKKEKKTATKDEPKPGKDIRNFFNNPVKDKSPASATVTSSNKPGSNIFGFNNFNGASSSHTVPQPSTGNPVNRVVGFDDLSTIDGASSSNPRTITGKGHVLGQGNSGANNPRSSVGNNRSGTNHKETINRKNSFPGKVSGMGGMLVNKGSGTLVVTGRQNKIKPPEKPESPNTKLRVDKFKVFTGPAFILGGNSAVDRSKSKLLSQGEPQIKKQKTDKTQEDSQDYNEDYSDLCKCSVCKKNIPREEMSVHLENCSGLQNVFNNSLVVDLEDETEIENINKKYKETACPICNAKIEGDINAHLDDCLSSSEILNIFNEPPIEIKDDNVVIFVDGYQATKPNNVTADDVEIIEQEEEARVACPLCGMRFGMSRIDQHVNQCLDSD